MQQHIKICTKYAKITNIQKNFMKIFACFILLFLETLGH